MSLVSEQEKPAVIMMQILTDPALHTDVSDVGSDTTQSRESLSPPKNPIIDKEDYPVFDLNMVAERASVYSSAASQDAELDTVQLPRTRSMINEVMEKIQMIPPEELKKHWQMASYAHLVQINDELVRELASSELVSIKMQEKFEEDLGKKLDAMHQTFAMDLKAAQQKYEDDFNRYRKVVELALNGENASADQ